MPQAAPDTLLSTRHYGTLVEAFQEEGRHTRMFTRSRKAMRREWYGQHPILVTHTFPPG